MLETFENEPPAATFLAGIFHHVAARSRADVTQFDDFDISELADVAHLGMEVTNQVRDMALAAKALRDLYQRYLREERPAAWKRLFKEATRTAYNLKYMFRESLPKARDRFVEALDSNLSGKPRELFAHLVGGAFRMYSGLVDQETLAKTDFMENPRALIQVVRDGVAGGDERVRLLGEIAARYMQTYVDQEPPKLPLTPHHTQIAAMLIFSQFYEQRARWADEYGMRAAILQMQTGEGKSIVIAMLAIYVAIHFKKRVHVLENNEGLLERDYANYASFYASFGLSCAKTIDATSDICYCLKSGNNAFFNRHMLAGDLDLSSTILIVDEVDDLVVNEKPTLLYKAKDDSLTPHYKACYRALSRGESRPPKVDNTIWNDAKRIKLEADSKIKGVRHAACALCMPEVRMASACACWGGPARTSVGLGAARAATWPRMPGHGRVHAARPPMPPAPAPPREGALRPRRDGLAHARGRARRDAARPQGAADRRLARVQELRGLPARAAKGHLPQLPVHAVHVQQVRLHLRPHRLGRWRGGARLHRQDLPVGAIRSAAVPHDVHGDDEGASQESRRDHQRPRRPEDPRSRPGADLPLGSPRPSRPHVLPTSDPATWDSPRVETPATARVPSPRPRPPAPPLAP